VNSYSNFGKERFRRFWNLDRRTSTNQVVPEVPRLVESGTWNLLCGSQVPQGSGTSWNLWNLWSFDEGVRIAPLRSRLLPECTPGSDRVGFSAESSSTRGTTTRVRTVPPTVGCSTRRTTQFRPCFSVGSATVEARTFRPDQKNAAFSHGRAARSLPPSATNFDEVFA